MMRSRAVVDCLRLQEEVAAGSSELDIERTNLHRILVIVNEAALRERVVAALRHAHFAVIAASSSRRGWNMLFEKGPDLIIMTEGSSPLASRIRQVSSIPIILLGSNGNKLALIRALVSGADCYMTVPLATDELVARTRSLLRRSSSPATEVVAAPLS